MKIFILIYLMIISLSNVFSQQDLVGKKVPGINIKQWVYPEIIASNLKNGQVSEKLVGNITVVDFWFTDCAPCVASIPHLNNLAFQFPEIVFLSITFEDEIVINNFLDKMKMFYPIGCDTDHKTIEAFGVNSYPETFIVDNEGIIQWRGNPFDLNAEKLNETLNYPVANQIIAGSNSEFPSENYAYYFTIKKHDLEMGEASYFHYNPFDINVFNKNLKDIFTIFYGLNGSRILTKDSILLNSTYDLTLKADKEITTAANCVEMLKYLLPKELNIQLTEITKDTLVQYIQIENDTLLNGSKSQVDFFGTTTKSDTVELIGASLINLIDFMENNYAILLEINQADNRMFDFTLPVNDINKVKETLKKRYGLQIKTKQQQTKFWLIENNN